MKIKNNKKLLLITLLYALVVSQVDALSYKITPIDPPGSISSQGNSINNKGEVAGYFNDGSNSHGFIFRNGTFRTIDASDAFYGTYLYSINDEGQVAGSYFDASYIRQGFIYSKGTLKTFDSPGSTYTGIINNRGDVVGYYIDDGDDGYLEHGYIYSKGIFRTIDHPDAAYSFVWPGGTQPSSINDRGEVVGVYGDGSNVNMGHGFIYSKGIFRTLDHPDAAYYYPWPSGNILTSINNRGQVAGYYGDGSGMGHGFIYSKGTFKIIDVPNAVATYPSSINNRGEVTGYYSDDLSSYSHGFIYRKGTFIPLDVPGAVYTFPISINNRGQVAGYYKKQDGYTHAFVASPVPGS